MTIEPVAVGKAMSDIADSSVGKALLVPAATSIGKYLGEQAEEWVERRRSKRLSNIGAHIQSFEQNFQKELFDIADDKGLFDWIEGVADVDANDAELSEVWQAALASLAEGGSSRRRLLAIVRELLDDEAKFIRDVASGYRHDIRWISIKGQRSLKRRLAEKGILLRDIDVFLSSSPGLVFYVVAWSSTLLLYYVGRAIGMFGYIDNLSIYSYLSLTAFGVGVVYYLTALTRRGYFSREGADLIGWVRRVQRANTTESQG